mgnify:CR=1 FL=1
MDRPDGRRVLKFDGLSGRGLWYRPQGDEFYNAACGGHVHIEYLFSPLTSYTLSRYAGLPLKGKREYYGIGFLYHMA